MHAQSSCLRLQAIKVLTRFKPIIVSNLSCNCHVVKSLNMCMYVYMYMLLNTYEYVYLYTSTPMYVYAYVYMDMYTYMQELKKIVDVYAIRGTPASVVRVVLSAGATSASIFTPFDKLVFLDSNCISTTFRARNFIDIAHPSTRGHIKRESRSRRRRHGPLRFIDQAMR